MTEARADIPGGQAVRENSWPITVVVVGQTISGVWTAVIGARSLVFFLAMGGPASLGNLSGEWSGLGGFFTFMSAFAGVYLPLAGTLRLLTAFGLHRRRSWARWIALVLSFYDLGLGLLTLLHAALLVLFHLPGLALAAVTVVVLFKKEYAAKFSSKLPPGVVHRHSPTESSDI
jgi:hypothetical protein